MRFAAPDVKVELDGIHLTIGTLKSKFAAHAARVPGFAANAEKIEQVTQGLLDEVQKDPAQVGNAIKTFSTAIKGITAQDQPILDDITTAVNELEAARVAIQNIYGQDLAKVLSDSLPRILFHSTTTDKIPNEVNVADFVKDPEGTSKGMANLCRVAGLTPQSTRDLAATTDTSQVQSYEDYYNGTVSGGLNEFWTQALYEVHFRIDKDRLIVTISDGGYTPRIVPSDRSDGFQWYLSFYATLQNETGLHNETVLLLDNPGLELHMDGQRDIKRFLEEKVALSSQVIYVTHSPAMVDPFNLRQIRTVELLPNHEGTKVRCLAPLDKATDLLEPVRSAIGMSLASSLIFNNWNILVEGAADKPIVEGIFFHHYPDRRSKILVNGSLSQSKETFLGLYQRANLPYVILLDADSGGRDLASSLQSFGIPTNRIVDLRDVFGDRQNDFELEDILSADFYHKAVLNAYPSNPVDLPSSSTRKRTAIYADAFKAQYNIGFNKRRVAESVKELLSLRQEDRETQDNLGTLSTALVAKLGIAEGDPSPTPACV
jgi:hypothetical protein